MANTIPYSHSSISALAKHLRESLLTEHGASIGQSQMLQMLARAAGYSNYQSLKARLDTASKPEELEQFPVKIATELEHVQEVFERSADGRVRDRRHERVSKILSFVSVTLRIGDVEAIFRVKAWAPIETVPDTEKGQLEKYFGEGAIRYLGENAKSLLPALKMTDTTEIDVSSVFHQCSKRPWDSSDNFVQQTFWVTQSVFDHLLGEVKKVKEATKTYGEHIRYLRDFVHNGVDVEEGRAARALAFIEDAIKVAIEPGRMTMYSWNHGKFPGIKRAVNKLLKGQGVGNSELETAYRSLFSMTPGNVWIGEPPA